MHVDDERFSEGRESSSIGGIDLLANSRGLTSGTDVMIVEADARTGVGRRSFVLVIVSASLAEWSSSRTSFRDRESSLFGTEVRDRAGWFWCREAGAIEVDLDRVSRESTEQQKRVAISLSIVVSEREMMKEKRSEQRDRDRDRDQGLKERHLQLGVYMKM